MVSLHKEALATDLSILDSTMSNIYKRKHLYTEYGPMGACNGIRIPECIVSYIHLICYNYDDKYMGHQDIGDGDDNVGHMDGDDGVNKGADEGCDENYDALGSGRS